MDTDGDKTFYTVTMARIYADQGRSADAARIYRYLLDRTPDRVDLQQALKAVSSMEQEAPIQWRGVSNLVERWVRLVLRRKALRQFNNIRITPDSADR